MGGPTGSKPHRQSNLEAFTPEAMGGHFGGAKQQRRQHLCAYYYRQRPASVYSHGSMSVAVADCHSSTQRCAGDVSCAEIKHHHDSC